MITADDHYTGVQRLTPVRALSLLDAAPNPLSPPERAALFPIFSAAGVDLLFALALWSHESRWSTDPTSVNSRYTNYNPGNLRNPPPDAPTVTTDRGPFLAFTSWTAGFQALATHLASPRYAGLTIAEAIRIYAPDGDGNDSEAYIDSVVKYMNTVGGTPMTRVIISAGHAGIGAITAAKIGAASARTLRTQTGAPGEVAWTTAWRDALRTLLIAAGIDTVITGATDDPAYATDADLIVVGHYDGAATTGGPQYAMAATVRSGPSTPAVDAVADRFVTLWGQVYPPYVGFPADGPITDNMTGYYGGWYRTPTTPMVIIEHGLGADGDGVRGDMPAPTLAARADAAAITLFFAAPPPPPPPEPAYVPAGNPLGAIAVHPILWPRWHYLDTLGLALPMVGWPTPTTPIRLDDGRVAQQFERGWLAGSTPADVVMLFPSEFPTTTTP